MIYSIEDREKLKAFMQVLCLREEDMDYNERWLLDPDFDVPTGKE